MLFAIWQCLGGVVSALNSWNAWDTIRVGMLSADFSCLPQHASQVISLGLPFPQLALVPRELDVLLRDLQPGHPRELINHPLCLLLEELLEWLQEGASVDFPLDSEGVEVAKRLLKCI